MAARQLALIGLLLFSLATEAAEERTWTDNQGKTLVGKLIEQNGDQITIEADGKRYTLPANRFSAEDQAYLKSIASSAEDPAPVEADKQKKKIQIVERSWTDNANRTIKARFVRMNNGLVVLQNASVQSVPFYNLSQDDQDYVREVLESRGQLNLIPARPPQPVNSERQPAVAPPANPGTNPFPAGSNPTARELMERSQQQFRESQQRMQEQMEKSRREAEERTREFQARMEADRKQREEDQRKRDAEFQERMAKTRMPVPAPPPTVNFPTGPPATIPAPPNIPNPTIPRPPSFTQDQYRCDKCNRLISKIQAKNNTHCPHCGVMWVSKPAEVSGNSTAFTPTSTPPSSTTNSTARQAGSAIGVLIGLAIIGIVIIAIIGIPVAIVVMIVRAASKPAPAHQFAYQQQPANPYGQPTKPYGQPDAAPQPTPQATNPFAQPNPYAQPNPFAQSQPPKNPWG